MKRQITLLLLATLLINGAQAKTFIFDANDTTVYFSRSVAMRNQLADTQFSKAFIAYCFETKQNPYSAYKNIQKRAFAVLDNYCQSIKDISLNGSFSGNEKMPALMSQMLRGDYSELAGQLHGRLAVDLFAKQNKFISRNERIIVTKIIHLMFCSNALTPIIYPFEDTLKAIKKLSKEVDQKGNKKHQIFILSNMQNEVYEKMKTHKPLKKLFKYIPESNWIISGKINMIKPNNDIFEYVLNTFNLDIKDCVFVDDQKENIDAAAKLGFKTIHCTDDRKKVIQQLETFAQ